MRSPKLLVNRYLWAVGSTAATIPVGEIVANRYQAIAPQIWQDMQPDVPPDMPEQLSGNILTYLRLYPHRLHVPEVYGVCNLPNSEQVILLENGPIDTNGGPYPSMEEMWSNVSAVRQVYWLSQMWELWKPLTELGVNSALLVPENLRVEGWRVRLRELYVTGAVTSEMVISAGESGDREADELVVGTASGGTTTLTRSQSKATIQQLGAYWDSLARRASGNVAAGLLEITQQMQVEKPDFKEITIKLNQVLLEEASRQPLRLEVAGFTDTGPIQNHNEDSCYPLMSELPEDPEQPRDPLIPHLSIICDGIGGHEGGEVASHMGVQSVKIQVRALLAELLEDPELMTPELVADQLSAIIRIVNNLISSSNDQQERSSRRRMGTTLTLALQLPQIIRRTDGEGNAHELYIANVGDSRAYWLTPRYCQLLTQDDDVVTREVKLGRSLYRQALQRPDATALTQAVGTREGELLRPFVRRFILEEDGLLLLCSDGLSDNNVVEQFGTNYARDVLIGRLSLEEAAKALIELANEKNGHDNTSVVLTYCGVSPQYPVVLDFGESALETMPFAINLDTDLVTPVEIVDEEESVVIPQPVEPEVVTTSQGDWLKVSLGVLGILVVLLSAGAAVLTAQWLLDPQGFKQMQDFLFPPQEIQTPPPGQDSKEK
ncbi:PP2C family protein-serine/threonine phosphatase [Limnofasciculus baicalensis]|uniref:Serine/threonine-protein phosphatase n=1 Tax=Limnofasciculus baicalensis BBK-W-15 TaxID=2699891 RepID=A0AAE3KQD1_9CYAN|nr:PP2C family serine/threonine-protein phosphatase [Limnofasciculus baicalensis]MCP2732329.1 serine/threonine-protein phosphatase [Limnofasciculus baicalensis BBK-W-15]